MNVHAFVPHENASANTHLPPDPLNVTLPGNALPFDVTDQPAPPLLLVDLNVVVHDPEMVPASVHAPPEPSPIDRSPEPLIVFV